MTFDDGYRRVHELAFPVLRKVSEMAAGIEIAAHGSHHRDLTNAPAVSTYRRCGVDMSPIRRTAASARWCSR